MDFAAFRFSFLQPPPPPPPPASSTGPRRSLRERMRSLTEEEAADYMQNDDDMLVDLDEDQEPVPEPEPAQERPRQPAPILAPQPQSAPTLARRVASPAPAPAPSRSASPPTMQPAAALKPADKKTFMIFSDLYSEATSISNEWASHADDLKERKSAGLYEPEDEPAFKRQKVGEGSAAKPDIQWTTVVPPKPPSTTTNPFEGLSFAPPNAPIAAAFKGLSDANQPFKGLTLATASTPPSSQGPATTGTKRPFLQMAAQSASTPVQTLAPAPATPNSSYGRRSLLPATGTPQTGSVPTVGSTLPPPNNATTPAVSPQKTPLQTPLQSQANASPTAKSRPVRAPVVSVKVEPEEPLLSISQLKDPKKLSRIVNQPRMPAKAEQPDVKPSLHDLHPPPPGLVESKPAAVTPAAPTTGAAAEEERLRQRVKEKVARKDSPQQQSKPTAKVTPLNASATTTAASTQPSQTLAKPSLLNPAPASLPPRPGSSSSTSSLTPSALAPPASIAKPAPHPQPRRVSQPSASSTLPLAPAVPAPAAVPPPPVLPSPQQRPAPAPAPAQTKAKITASQLGGVQTNIPATPVQRGPTAVAETPSAVPPTPATAPVDPHLLPQGWKLMTSQKNGKVYYYNRSTGESQWDPPKVSEVQPDTLDSGNDDPELQRMLADQTPLRLNVVALGGPRGGGGSSDAGRRDPAATVAAKPAPTTHAPQPALSNAAIPPTLAAGPSQPGPATTRSAIVPKVGQTPVSAPIARSIVAPNVAEATQPESSSAAPPVAPTTVASLAPNPEARARLPFATKRPALAAAPTTVAPRAPSPKARVNLPFATKPPVSAPASKPTNAAPAKPASTFLRRSPVAVVQNDSSPPPASTRPYVPSPSPPPAISPPPRTLLDRIVDSPKMKMAARAQQQSPPTPGHTLLDRVEQPDLASRIGGKRPRADSPNLDMPSKRAKYQQQVQQQQDGGVSLAKRVAPLGAAKKKRHVTPPPAQSTSRLEARMSDANGPAFPEDVYYESYRSSGADYTQPREYNTWQQREAYEYETEVYNPRGASSQRGARGARGRGRGRGRGGASIPLRDRMEQ